MVVQKLRVFVVDDEPIIVSTLAAILQSRGYDAVPFTRPEDAMEASRSNPPHLLITDVIMPAISGIELAHEMLEFCPECRVLMFSGQAATTDFADAKNGNDRYEILTKPVHPNVLLEKIREILTFTAVPAISKVNDSGSTSCL